MVSPTQCFMCQDTVHHELSWSQLFSFKQLEYDCVCVKCRSQFIPFTRQENSCSGCGKIVTYKTFDENGALFCQDCKRWLKRYPANYLKHETIFEYNETLREWLYRYKYQADRRQSEVVKSALGTFYGQRATHQWLVLPSSPASLKERGFHATGSLLDDAGIPYTMPLVYKGDGHKQAKKNRQQRISMQQPFELVDLDVFVNCSQSWVIFDDVYTTGTTLLKAKEVIFSNWVSSGRSMKDLKIISVSLARESLKEKDAQVIKNSLKSLE